MSATDAVTKKSSTTSSLRREVSFWSTWLFGTAVSTVAVISFIQIKFGAHLVPAYAHGLAVYREVAHSIVGWFYSPFVYPIELVASWFHFSLHISIPGWWKDLASISMVSSMAAFRGMIIANRDNSGIPIKGLLVIVALVGFCGGTLLGLLWPVLVTAELFTSEVDDARVKSDRAYLLSLVAIAVAAAFFFVTNAYQL